jgi:glycosyltransferase involved in cell wall biosynthesis
MSFTKQKTVLYIGGFELPDRNAAAQRVISNAKILKALGYEVVFISIDKTIKTKESILNTKSYFEGFTYFRIKYPNNIFEWLSYLISIRNVIDLQFINPSILIAYNYPALALMKLKKYCGKNNIKILADCTEWYEAQGNAIFRLIKSIDVYLRMRLIQPRLNGLIVISDYLLNFYRNKSKNLVLLPPLVDLSMNKWQNDKQSFNDDIIRLVYAGSPGGGQKDRLDQIIRILSKIKETTTIQFIFNVIGLTKTEFTEQFKNELVPQNIDDFISFKGRQTHNDTIKEIINADYQIFLRDENLTNKAGFPTKYVESVSCGTPVLTNLSSNIGDYFISGKTGFLLDISSDKILENGIVKALLQSKESIKQMSGFCKSSSLFDYHNYINSFHLFLKKSV